MRSIIFFILLLSGSADAQEFKYLIHFRDKNNNGFSLAEPSSFLSAKSIQRRASQHIALDSTDLPMTATYMDSISGLPSVRILNKSKWFNQVLVALSDSTELDKIRGFSFVVSSEPVNNRRLLKIRERVSLDRINSVSNNAEIQHPADSLNILSGYNYGSSYAQIHIHQGEYLHNLGFHGENKTIAMLDNGFSNYLGNPAFDSVRTGQRILGTYDFVNQKISVNEESNHGANCFSIIASNIPGTLVGSAPGANFWLFKTEDDSSESPVEEQNWVAAAEFADSVGVDLITTSLGYAYFDDPVYNLNYPERNGHTALVSRAANLAVSKGMIVTASIGNSGPETDDHEYALCPADGDSVYAVGAVNASGVIASFSSLGPNASGQTKPDGVSVGNGTFVIGNDGQLYAGSGTSYSNPNLAGLIVCLWQAFPECTAHDILAAVRYSSSQYTHPDRKYGFGIPDFEKAFQTLLLKRLAVTSPFSDLDWIRVFPVPFHQSLNLFFKPAAGGTALVQIFDVSGKRLLTQSFPVNTDIPQWEEVQIPSGLASGEYFLRYSDSKKTKTLKILKD